MNKGDVDLVQQSSSRHPFPLDKDGGFHYREHAVWHDSPNQGPFVWFNTDGTVRKIRGTTFSLQGHAFGYGTSFEDFRLFAGDPARSETGTGRNSDVVTYYYPAYNLVVETSTVVTDSREQSLIEFVLEQREPKAQSSR
ncbi:MAG: hypothetical protein AMXMBFR33_24000 [Candidatus Xenobia bacterium]|jgi:hypothetical protein